MLFQVLKQGLVIFADGRQFLVKINTKVCFCFAGGRKKQKRIDGALCKTRI